MSSFSKVYDTSHLKIHRTKLPGGQPHSFQSNLSWARSDNINPPRPTRLRLPPDSMPILQRPAQEKKSVVLHSLQNPCSVPLVHLEIPLRFRPREKLLELVKGVVAVDRTFHPGFDIIKKSNGSTSTGRSFAGGTTRLIATTFTDDRHGSWWQRDHDQEEETLRKHRRNDVPTRFLFLWENIDVSETSRRYSEHD